MKKTIIGGLVFIVLGFFLGSSIYKGTYSNVTDVFNQDNTFYFLQEGVYENKESLKKNTQSLEQKVVVYENNKYFVYVGITKNEDVLNKLKNIYKEKGLQLYEKEQTINNDEFINNVEQFDLLIKQSTENDEILAIEEVVLANYDSLINK